MNKEAHEEAGSQMDWSLYHSGVNWNTHLLSRPSRGVTEDPQCIPCQLTTITLP